MAENLGASFSIDIGNLKAGLTEANRLIRQSNSEFLAAAAGMDDWQSSVEGLEAKNQNLNQVIDLQTKKVNALVKQKEDIISTMQQEGKTNDEINFAIDAVNKQIEKESKALIKSKNELSKNEKALNELKSSTDSAGRAANDASGEVEELADSLDEQASSADKASDSTSKAEKALSGLKGIGSVVGGALKAVASAAAGVVTSFFALAEGTREMRTQMAKVETAFTSAGKTAEQAQETYDGLYAVLGDSDRATEASGNLAQLAKDQQDLTDWTTIATGVYASFGDGLPIESLTEAANETAKVGTVTGSLADALNWSSATAEQWSASLSGNAKAQSAFNKAISQGMSVEDAFNEALLACNNEQERGELITSALTATYSDAAAKYRETAADIIAANEAQNRMNKALADLGAIAEPIMTAVKNLGANILFAITPGVELIGEGLTGAFNGAADAGDKLGQGVGSVLDSLIKTITGMLPMVTDMIDSLIPALLSSLLSALPSVLQAGTDILNSLLEGILLALPQLVTTAGMLITQLCATLGTLLPDIVSTIIRVLPLLIDALMAATPQILDAAIILLTALVDAVPVICQNLIGVLPGIAETIINSLVSALPSLMGAAVELLMAIVEAIPQIVDALLSAPALPKIIDTIISAVLGALPQLLNAAIILLLAIVDAIPKMLPTLISYMPRITSVILNAVIGALPQLLSTAGQLFMQIIQAIINFIPKLPGKLKDIINAIVDGLKKGISSIKDVGKNLIEGLWNGINDMTSWIKDKIKGFGSSVVNGLKDFFGIHSPAKLIEDEVGKNLALGVGKGFTDEIGAVNKSIVKSVDGISPKIGVAAAGGTGTAGGGVVINQYNTYSQAHSRYELFKSKQQTAAAVRLALAGSVKA